MTNKQAGRILIQAAVAAALVPVLIPGTVNLCSAAGVSGTEAVAVAEAAAGNDGSIVSAVVATIVAAAVILVIIALMPRKRPDRTE